MKKEENNYKKENFILKFLKDKIFEFSNKGFKASTANGFINPLCEIEVTGLKKTDGTPDTFKQPFMYLVHTYLKDYGFNPESMIKDKSPIVIFRMAQGSEIKFPLYVKTQPEGGFGNSIGIDEVIKKGYIIPSEGSQTKIKA